MDQGRKLPPGQAATRDWPVLHYGEVPRIDLAAWRLRLFGLVDTPVELTYSQVKALPRTQLVCDIHCVTRWSRLDNLFEGVLVSELLKLVALRPEAQFAVLHAEGGWSTNLPLSDLLRENVLLAWAWKGLDLSPEHGWPLRAVVPHLYFWKSAKWLRGIEFLAEDQPGFWEQNGYHRRGDPWQNIHSGNRTLSLH